VADDRTLRIRLLGEETVSSRAARPAERALGDLEDQMDDTGRAAATLDRRIGEVESSLKELAVTAATDLDNIDLRKKIRVEQADLNRLKKLRSAIGEVGSEVAATAGRGFNLLGGSFASLPPQAQAGLAAAGAAIAATVAPAVGAGISAGVLLGLGGGALAAGIASALKDPEVAAAWKTLGNQAQQAFARFGEPFKEPMIRAAATFGQALDRMGPAFDRISAAVAPLADKLAPALADLAVNAMPGIEKAIKASAPLFEVLAQQAPKIGAALSSFFESIAKGGPGAARFFEDMIVLLNGTIVVTGEVIEALAKMYGFWRTGADQMARAVAAAFRFLTGVVLGWIGTMINAAARAFGWVPGIGPKLRAAAAKFNEFRDRVNAALRGIKNRTVDVRIRVLADKGVRVAGVTGAGGFTERAAGGPVSPNNTYLVGEKGPELLSMGGQGGHITPNHRLPGAVQGGSMAGIAQALRGVQVVLDGRVVGRLEGRRADLLERGG
jgi:hypothetical protein